MIITIDPYYDIPFFNRVLESLKNNKIPFNLFVDSKSPYYFYIDQPVQPTYLDYEILNTNRERNLVSIVEALQPSTQYKFARRASHTGLKGMEYYTLNDQFGQMQKEKQAHIVHMHVEHAFKVSKQYPRKLYFLGRYYNNSHIVFAQDSLLLKNYLTDIPHKVLQSSSSFQHSTELEQEINYKHFLFKDRIIKLEKTPYLLNGKYYPPTIVNEYKRKFILESSSDPYSSEDELLEEYYKETK